MIFGADFFTILMKFVASSGDTGGLLKGRNNAWSNHQSQSYFETLHGNHYSHSQL